MYNNHTLQTNPRQREEEPHINNNLQKPGIQIRQRNQLSLPHQVDFKSREATKHRTTKHVTSIEPHNGSKNQQQLTTTEPPPKNGQQTKPLSGLNAFYWYQTGTLANGENPDKMPHHVAFHQGMHCLLWQNRSSGNKMYLRSLNIFNGQSWLNCIKLYGKSHWYTKSNESFVFLSFRYLHIHVSTILEEMACCFTLIVVCVNVCALLCHVLMFII